MDNILGADNGLVNYGMVLLIYGLIFLLVWYPKNTIELNSRSSFLLLYFFWSIFIFAGNYVGFLLGVMSFLPWLDNFIHSFIWVGFMLTWLYFSTRGLPWYYRCFLAGMYSFIIKYAEHTIIATWSFDPYFFFTGPYAYIIIMALVDCLYPPISDLLLTQVNKKFPSIYLPG
ncbi:MAG TPA: hypothetical protein VNU72_13885 [Puia sp.]|jgi:hypothetical protein|nr:hypothetical protein [Puia sp.]